MTAALVATLVRQPFCPIEVAENWDRDLIQLARKLINYNPTAIAKAEEIRTRSTNELIFADVLHKLEIEPFTVRSVRTYQSQMLKEAHKGESWAFTRWMHGTSDRRHEWGRGQLCVQSVGIPSWIGFGIAAILTGIGHFAGYTAGWGWDNVAKKSIELTDYMSTGTAEAVLAVPVAALAAWALLMFLRHKKAWQINAAWAKHTVDAREYQPGHAQGYNEPIPAFALQRMVALKQELPEVTFSVESLESSKLELNTQKAEKRPSDPFLIATYRGISAYVDVWDEPKFEGVRQV